MYNDNETILSTQFKQMNDAIQFALIHQESYLASQMIENLNNLSKHGSFIYPDRNYNIGRICNF